MTFLNCIFKFVLLSIAVLAATGCASTNTGSAGIEGAVNQTWRGFQQGIAAMAGGTTASASNPKSSFQGIFPNSVNSQWPRLAVTIHRATPDAYARAVNNYVLAPNFCMVVSAVVWTDAKTSRVIPQENFCPNQAPSRWVGHSIGDFLRWSRTTSTSANTGASRTVGLNPPSRLFPEGSKFGNFPGTRLHLLFQAFVVTTGFDLTIDPGQDRRFWIVNVPGETEV